MGSHSGQQDTADDAARAPRSQGRLFLLAAFVTVTIVAWGVLVLAAIDFGREARSGDSEAWTFLAIAAGGGTACLFVAIILAARIVALVRGRGKPPRPPRLPGGRRAAR